MEQKTYLFILMTAFIFEFLFAVIFLYYLHTVATKCMQNPYIYGASIQKNIYCSCQQKQGKQFAYFYFNDTAMWNQEVSHDPYNPPKLDFEKFNITLTQTNK